MLNNLPPVTKALLGVNAAMFLLQWLFGLQAGPDGDAALSALMLWPAGGGEWVAGYATPGFQPWQLLTYGFLHGSLPHLLFNMLALVMFGAQLEYTWGQRRFLTYFLVCVVGAGLCQLGVVSWTVAQGGPPFPTVGASGGVFGLLLAYGMLFPHQRVMLLIPPIPMKARTLVFVYGAVELLMGITGTQSGVAHFAHLGGMLFGWLLIRHWRGQPPFSGRPRARRF